METIRMVSAATVIVVECLLIESSIHQSRNRRRISATMFCVATPIDQNFVSATLDEEALATVRNQCGFAPNVDIFKTALDRPEIFMQFSPMKGTEKHMEDLQHMLPAQVQRSQDIPKTVVYVDKVIDVNRTCERIRRWMVALGYPPEARDWVQPMAAPMAEDDKKHIQDAFKRRSENCPCPRILICTDASYGLGVDHPDIQRVYIWMLSSSIAKIYQRLGRANRCGEGLAHFIFLFPRWCKGIRSGKDMLSPLDMEKSNVEDANPGSHRTLDEQGDLTETEEPKSKKKLPKAEDRRRDMSRGIWGLINPTLEQGSGCHRETGLKFFNDVELNDTTPSTFEQNRPNPCCSACHPDRQISIDPPAKLNRKRMKDKPRRLWLRRELEEWRKRKAIEVLECSFLRFIPSLVMPNAVLKILETWGHLVSDNQDLIRELGDIWGTLPKYSAEILEILKRGQSLDINSDEIVTEIRRDKSNADAKKAGTLPSIIWLWQNMRSEELDGC